MKDNFAKLSALDDSQWLELILRGGDPSQPDGLTTPALPDPSVQLAFNVAAGEQNLRVGFAIYRQIKQAIGTFGLPLTPESPILDFGCGWGRVVRFFAKDVRAENIFGVDISRRGIANCKETLPGNFAVSDRHPPLEFEASRFEAIYAWSVFSHLPEPLHLEWLAEFSRLLRPGGLVIASTLTRSFVLESERLKNEGGAVAAWQQAASECFDDFEEALAAYDRGDFLFSPKPDAEYGMAAIPEAYVRREWTKYFEICDFIAKPPQLGQSLIIARKRPS